MKALTLSLSAEEQQDLERIRSTDARPYMREKAAALLKIAGGMASYAVARHGLLKPRAPDTVYIWLKDYQETRKLREQPARRKRLFSPQSPELGEQGE